jgi:hypothetical protein
VPRRISKPDDDALRAGPPPDSPPGRLGELIQREELAFRGIGAPDGTPGIDGVGHIGNRGGRVLLMLEGKGVIGKILVIADAERHVQP